MDKKLDRKPIKEPEPKDFWRGSRGFNKPFGIPASKKGKSFIGFRRGSR